MTEPSRRVKGIDACTKGWIGITSDSQAYFAVTIDQLVATAAQDGELGVVAIDIPIGLLFDSAREADLLVRSIAGKRASSVFPTAVRAAVLAPNHAALQPGLRFATVARCRTGGS